MTDRLAELRKATDLSSVSIDINKQNDNLLPSSSNPMNSGSSFMQEFFKDVEIIKNIIITIKNATIRVGDINQQVVLATSNEKELEISSDLAPLIAETNKKAAIGKALLQRLREDTDRHKEKSASSEIRIRENLCNTLTRKFVDVMKEYQNIQTKYKTDIKKKVKRQVQIVKEDATNEEIEAIMQSGGASEIFKQTILKGDAADSITNAFMNVKDKYQDILTLEASVSELHQMFMDFALLTEQQGELLDQISYQVSAAGDYIEEGNKEMVVAIEYQKSIRYKQCCMLAVVLVVIAIIITVVIVKTQTS